jgi:hypothetical protein
MKLSSKVLDVVLMILELQLLLFLYLLAAFLANLDTTKDHFSR